MREVTILKTGLANLASVLAAFDRLGVQTTVTTEAESIRRAQRLVVPGVGSYGEAMSRLAAAQLTGPLQSRIDDGRSTLGIRLGLQIFGLGSDESPGVPGLGCVPARTTGFNASVISPQMGWNQVTPTADSQLLEAGHAYFANSFRFETIPDGWAGATAQYGGALVAALERGGVLGCQFHPELSGAYGERLLARWLETEPC